MLGETPHGPILITGGSGQVGSALIQTLAPLGNVLAPTRGQLDLTDLQSIHDLMREVRPRWVVNAAAYTAVDKAESEPELAFAINSTAAETIAEEAISIGAGLIHFSTDYVFDGSKATPYVESDPPCPLNVYGRSKLAGEKALTASRATHLSCSARVGFTEPRAITFSRTILRLARERDHLVADQHGAPTWRIRSCSDDGSCYHLHRTTCRAIEPLPVRDRSFRRRHLPCKWSGRNYLAWFRGAGHR